MESLNSSKNVGHGCAGRRYKAKMGTWGDVLQYFDWLKVVHVWISWRVSRSRHRTTKRLTMKEVYEIKKSTRLEHLAQARMKKIRETSSLMCPLCCKRNGKQFENMWRLEQWLSHSEATQSTLRSPLKLMEGFEDEAQDHTKSLMNLDGHKSVIMSLNVIVCDLANHIRNLQWAHSVSTRLNAASNRWEGVCIGASEWQAKLQAALMDNS